MMDGKHRGRSRAPDRRPVTMRHLAEVAGVSQTTVSRVLNGVEGSIRIPATTRERVLQAARDLGYRPNPFARGLRGSQTGTIGLVVREAFDPFFSLLTAMITSEARKQNYSVVMGAAEGRVQDATRLTWALDTQHCDGILLLGDLRDQPNVLADANAHGRPLLALCVGGRMGDVPTVNTDNIHGATLAMEHLWSLGHRQIAMLYAWVGDHAQRLEGYLNFMRDRSQNFPAEYIQPATHDAKGGYLATQTLLNLKERPTAIFASNDMLAIGALKAAYDLGIRVPSEISLVGFDDTPLAEFFTPALTTVHQPVAEMAELAVQDLLRMVTDFDFKPPAFRALEPALVFRQSTAAISG